LWWTTDKGGKNACVNGPGAIAAYLLYTTLGDSTYLTKAQNIYNWEMATLFNTNNGAIYDSISSAGSINTWASTYNQGTFVGAANYLGDVASATLAANYMLGSRGLLPDYGIGGNNSGFNGIGMRWVAKFMNDRNLQNNYLAALQFNANTAYMNRRSDGLSWCSWEYPTPSGNLDSWSCISSVVAMQVVPPTFPYTWVTNENGTVNFSTPVDAAFGANGSDFFKYGVAGSIAFNTATFGDPIYGVAKSGYATAFTNCAVENGSYTFTVPVTAAYGAQGKYNYNPCVSGTVAFNNATFNDPISGVAKAGYYMPYTLCAIEGQSNTFTSPTYVAFGVNGHYYFKTNVTGTITFNTTTFRDPDVGVAKFGYYRSVTTAPVVGISNASFETPSVGTGYWYNPPGGNWTFDSDSGIQANSSAWGAPTAPDGTQTAFVQISNGTNNGSLWQMAYCTAGTHTLSFKAALRSINNGAITLNVLVDGTVVGTYSPTTTTSFTSYTTSSFTTTLANHKIQFTAVGTTAVDATIFIDVVSIQ
jgi:hypothetical protein